jgi:hypothetical protein
MKFFRKRLIGQHEPSARNNFRKIAEIGTRAKSNRWKIAAGIRLNLEKSPCNVNGGMNEIAEGNENTL